MTQCAGHPAVSPPADPAWPGPARSGPLPAPGMLIGPTGLHSLMKRSAFTRRVGSAAGRRYTRRGHRPPPPAPPSGGARLERVWPGHPPAWSQWTRGDETWPTVYGVDYHHAQSLDRPRTVRLLSVHQSPHVCLYIHGARNRACRAARTRRATRQRAIIRHWIRI